MSLGNSKSNQVQMIPPTISMDIMFSGMLEGVSQGLFNKLTPFIRESISTEVKEIKSHMVEKPMSVKEAADFIGIAEDTLYKWVREGDLPATCYHKVNSRVFIFPSEIISFIKKS